MVGEGGGQAHFSSNMPEKTQRSTFTEAGTDKSRACQSNEHREASLKHHLLTN